MKKFIYLSIAIASLTLVSFRELNSNEVKTKKTLKVENKKLVKYLKFDHNDKSLGDITTPPLD